VRVTGGQQNLQGGDTFDTCWPFFLHSPAPSLTFWRIQPWFLAPKQQSPAMCLPSRRLSHAAVQVQVPLGTEMVLCVQTEPQASTLLSSSVAGTECHPGT
jgi:hypothetical protein